MIKLIYYHGQVYDPLVHSEEPPAADKPEHIKLGGVTESEKVAYQQKKNKWDVDGSLTLIHIKFTCPGLLERGERIRGGVDQTLPQAAVVIENQQQQKDV